MDKILQRMHAVQWKWATNDSNALAILEQRIAETGKKLQLITYSDLVSGVIFHLPNIRNGQDYQINTYAWSGLDRGIIGEFLAYISVRSYEQSGFMASSLVVSANEFKPSWHFFEWMKKLNVLPDINDDTVLAFWAEQVNRAHKWYKAQQK